jgi:hypothetical protein
VFLLGQEPKAYPRLRRLRGICHSIFSTFLIRNGLLQPVLCCIAVGSNAACKKLQINNVPRTSLLNTQEAAMKLTVLRLSALVASLWWLCSVSGGAQVSATLSGRVTDATGSAVAVATVTANDVETGVSRAVVTNQVGQYEMVALPIGRYEVRATKQGFAERIRTGVVLVVGQDATADLVLQVGEVKEHVTVTEDTPIVNVSTQDISGLVGEKQVKELPLNGRSYDLLLTLNPGIVNFTSQKTGGVGVSNSTTGNNFAVSGNRPQQNLFLLNGVEFTGAAENNMQPGGPSQQLLGVEAVREFNVLRDSYGAEYGKRPSAQVIIVTQSGSNQWHGSAY